MNVFPLPTAAADPVKQARRRGRLPRNVGKIREVQLRRMCQERLPEVAVAVSTQQELTASDRQLVTEALAILERTMNRSEIVSGCTRAKQFLCLQLGALPHEVFGVIFLTPAHRLIAYESLFRGTIDQAAVYPREIALRALAHNAGAVVLAHNHPSGSVQPSQADKALTQTLRAALSMIGVLVLDHVIVSGDCALSMAECGFM